MQCLRMRRTLLVAPSLVGDTAPDRDHERGRTDDREEECDEEHDRSRSGIEHAAKASADDAGPRGCRRPWITVTAMIVLADTDLAPAMVALLGVVLGSAITAVVPAIFERRRARAAATRDFARAAYFVWLRVSKIETAAAAFASPAGAEAALQKPECTPLAPEDKTIRDEVFLLGGDLDRLVMTYPDVRRRTRPKLEEFQRVSGPLSELLIRHRVAPVGDEKVKSDLAEWSQLAK